jgi:DNA helicase-2/ATP-dependent DNA helicase PcrA
MRFYQRQEIKDALAYARVILNPQDEISLMRIVNTPPRGIGKTSLERIKAYAHLKNLNALDSFKAASDIENLTPSCRRSLTELSSFLEKMQADLPSLSAGAAMARILEESGYLSWLEKECETDLEAASRLANVQELLNSVKEYEERREAAGSPLSLGQYLEEISLQTDRDDTPGGEESVTLMTIHLAKGLEFPVVFLTGLEEGLFPIGSNNSSPEELEEERRLCYVGMTRAKEMLYLTHASTRRVFGQTYSNIPSRFIMEARLEGEFLSPQKRLPPQPLSAPHSPNVPSQRMGASLRIGSRVRHPLFGTGEVLEKSGSGETAKALIRFQNGRIAKLVLRYAPLEVI